MSKSKQFTSQALIIKRKNTGELDRIITLLSQERGKFICIAKGARKLKSSKLSLLEPGNLIKASFVDTKSLPIMTQAQLLYGTELIHGHYAKMRQLVQALEIFDRLLVEEEIEVPLFETIIYIRNQIVSDQKTTTRITQAFNKLLSLLGYQIYQQNQQTSLLDHIAELTERPMRSWKYLSV